MKTPLELNRVPLFPFKRCTGTRLRFRRGVRISGSTVGIPESGGQQKSSLRATLSSDLPSVTFWAA